MKQNIYKNYVTTFSIGCLSIILAYILGGYQNAIIVGVFILLLLLITRSIWRSTSTLKYKVRLVSLFIVLSVVGTINFWESALNQLFIVPLIDYLNNRFGVKIDLNPGEINLYEKILMYSFVFFSIFIINYFNREKELRNYSEEKIDLNNKDRKNRFVGFIKMLQRDLNEVNRIANWQDDFYVEIETTVTVISGMKRYVLPFTKSIRINKELETFLLLGNPGSGKSVALRKLYSDLLKEAPKTGIMPIYINLKYWYKQINEESYNLNHLQSFIKNTLYERGDIYAKRFLDRYYDDLVEEGKIFFILDSFDEIPIVLSLKEEDQETINRLSIACSKLINGSQKSRGILASRIFKKPTAGFEQSVTLILNKIDEYKIRTIFSKKFIDSDSIIKNIYDLKPELGRYLKNPFNSTLLIEYLQNNSSSLPDSIFQLYENYFDARLNEYETELAEINLTVSEVDRILKLIALLIFEKEDSGLSLSTKDLIDYYEYDLREIFSYLEKTNIIRISESREKISFSHRRFAEYYIVKNMIDDKIQYDLDSIPNDSKHRDSLVLYTQVVSAERKEKIIEFCYQTIMPHLDESTNVDFDFLISNPISQRLIHTFRFLADAFINAPADIAAIRPNIMLFMLLSIRKNRPLEAKLLIENCTLFQNLDDATSVTILEESEGGREYTELEILNSIFERAVGFENSWITETLLDTFKYHSGINWKTERLYIKYILSYSPFSMISNYNKLKLNFKYAKLFSKVELWLRFKYVDSILYFVGMITLLLSTLYFGWMFVFIFSLFFIYDLAYSNLLSMKTTKLTALFSFNSLLDVHLFRLIPLILMFSYLNSYYSNGIWAELITLIAFILLMPISTYLYYATSISEVKEFFNSINIHKISFKSILIGVGQIVLGLSIVALCVFTIALIMGALPNFMLILIMAFCLIVGVVGLAPEGFISGILDNIVSVSDRKRWNRYALIISSSRTLNRRDVYEMVQSMNSVYYRKKLTNLIYTNRVVFYGEWPENEIPYFSEFSGELLAKVDEWSYGY